MGEYIQQLLGVDAVEARRVQKGHFHAHGTTLAGLMATHGVDPHDFLDFVHDIDLARLTADPALVAALDRLPGRKFVFTNADEALCPARARPARPRQRVRRHARHPRHGLCAQARSRRLCRDLRSGTASIRTRALFADDMARNLDAGQGARHDHGLGRQWLGAGERRCRPDLHRLSHRRISPSGSSEILGEEVA